MKHKRWLSILLALTILLGCIGWTPTTALPLSSPTNNASTMAPDEPATAQPNTVPPEVGGRGGKTAHLGRLRDEEKDDLNKFVYLNEDGSKTMYLYDHPVKYRDENGEIQDISLDIADTGDKNYPFRTKANSAVTTFPAALSDGITLSGNGVELRLAAQMPSGNTALNHQARRLDDQTVAYTYDDKTTIEYALTYTGFKEDIVISEYTGQTEYHFVLHTNGLILANLGGAYYLTDDTGQIKATIGDVIVFTADERNNTFGRLEVATIKEKQVYAMTIVLDADYLADPNTKYPIRIDPTVSLTYSADGANAIEDVTIQSENVSYPENASVSVGLRSYGISRLLMKFNLDFSDYEGVTVTSATVSVRDLMCESTEMTVYCYPFTGTAWTESSASWSSLTQSWGGLQDSQIISYDNGLTMDTAHYYPFDISSIVQQWIDGDADPEKGVIFKASSTVETATTLESRIFGSFERESYQPIFEMTYLLDMTLSYSSKDVDEGDSFTLTASTSEGTLTNVTWTSSNPTVATVDETGVVTGLKAGTATIFATSADTTESAYCMVYVTLADGVYRITSAFSFYHLSIYDVDNDSSYEVCQKTIKTSGMDYLAQLWRVQHIYNGYYYLSPMSNLCQYLVLSDDDVQIRHIADTNSANTSTTDTKWTITFTEDNYIIRNSLSYDDAIAPTSSSAGAQIVADTYNPTTPLFLWRMVLIPGVFLCSSDSSKGISTGTTLYFELGETFQIGHSIVSGTGNLDEQCTWYTGTYYANSINMNTGVINGTNRGQTVGAVGAVINGELYMLDFTIICRETIYIDNYYDSTVSQTIIGKIDEAVDFLNLVYNEEFYLYFAMNGVPSQYSNAAVDICSWGSNSSCDIISGNSRPCSDDCAEHHKNVHRIANDLYDNLWEPNHVVVMWSNFNESIFCYKSSSGIHMSLGDSIGPFALVTKIETNGELFFQPIVQILRVNNYEGSSDSNYTDEMVMSIFWPMRLLTP